jgi:hypothetical protein
MDIQFTQAEKNAIHKLLRKEDTLCIVNLIDSEDYQLHVEWVDETPIAFESNKIDEYEWEENELEFETLPIEQQALALKLYKNQLRSS